MPTLHFDIDWSSLVESAGLTFLHFLWQGTAIAAVLALGLHLLRRSTPEARYAVSLAAMIAMILAPLSTFFVLSVRPVADVPPLGEESLALLTQSFEGAREIPWLYAMLTAFWGAGAILFHVRVVLHWTYALRLRRKNVRVAPAAVRSLVRETARRWRISRPVRVLESGLTHVPIVVGWLRPVILLPASALTALPPEQLRAVILHELAHVRRHDGLVNLVQAAFESTFFFHPAVWWVSNRIRVEREYCCDDAAAGRRGEALAYARALLTLDGLRSPHTGPVNRLAMSSTGGPLMKRIRRIVGAERDSAGRAVGWAVPLVLVAVAALAFVAMRPAVACPPEKNEKAKEEIAAAKRNLILAEKAAQENLMLAKQAELEARQAMVAKQTAEAARAAAIAEELKVLAEHKKKAEVFERMQAERARVRELQLHEVALRAKLDEARARYDEHGSEKNKRVILELEKARELQRRERARIEDAMREKDLARELEARERVVREIESREKDLAREIEARERNFAREIEAKEMHLAREIEARERQMHEEIRAREEALQREISERERRMHEEIRAREAHLHDLQRELEERLAHEERAYKEKRAYEEKRAYNERRAYEENQRRDDQKRRAYDELRAIEEGRAAEKQRRDDQKRRAYDELRAIEEARAEEMRARDREIAAMQKIRAQQAKNEHVQHDLKAAQAKLEAELAKERARTKALQAKLVELLSQTDRMRGEHQQQIIPLKKALESAQVNRNEMSDEVLKAIMKRQIEAVEQSNESARRDLIDLLHSDRSKAEILRLLEEEEARKRKSRKAKSAELRVL